MLKAMLHFESPPCPPVNDSYRHAWSEKRDAARAGTMRLLIFLELDESGDFARVHRSFRAIASDYAHIAHHFEWRFYPFEIICELMARLSVHKERLDLIQVCAPVDICMPKQF